jgi:hypothetical protein
LPVSCKEKSHPVWLAVEKQPKEGICQAFQPVQAQAEACGYILQKAQGKDFSTAC